MSDDVDESRAHFAFFSNEYAQALQAFEAIQLQAAKIVALGGADDLRQFIDQFLLMAGKTRDAALEKGERDFAEWFSELMAKAEAIRKAVEPVE